VEAKSQPMPGRAVYDFMYGLGLARAFWSRVDRWEIRGRLEREREPG